MYRQNPYLKLLFSKPLGFFSLLVVICFLINSCNKENSASGTEAAQEQQASTVLGNAEAEADIVFNSTFDVAIGANDDVGLSGIGIFSSTSNCYTVTVTHLSTSSTFPIRVVVDFGTTGCTGYDGHIRKGKVITEYSKRLVEPGATATTSFENYFIDTIQCEGQQMITNTSANAQRQFTTVVTAKLTKPNNNYTEWTSQRVITQTEGLSTPNVGADDVFQMSGSGTGRVRKDNLLVAWQSTITEPLIKKFNCRWIVKGKLSNLRANTPASSPWAATVDFGNGDCDNQAVLTINGMSYNISLH